MKIKLMVITFIFLISLTSFACSSNFTGRVIDADTKQPIEGAVVVATWLEERATVAGSTARFKDVKETLTNKNGEWVIEGPRGIEIGKITALFTFVTGKYITTPPQFIIFKPGYCPWPKGFFVDACREKIKPENDERIATGKIVELPRLIKREDRWFAHGIWPPLMESDKESKRKIIKFIELLNVEARYLGIPEDSELKELKNE